MNHTQHVLGMAMGLLGGLAACSTVDAGQSTIPSTRDLGESTQALVTHPGQLGPLAAWLHGSAGVTTDANGQVIAWADQSGNGQVLGRGDAPLVSSITRDFVPGSTRRGILFNDGASAHAYLVNGNYLVKPPLTIGIVLHPLELPKSHLAPHVLLGAFEPTIAVGKECEYTLVGSLPPPPTTVCPFPSFPEVCFSAGQPSVPCVTPDIPGSCPTELPPTVTYDCKFGAAAGSPTTIVRDTLWSNGTHHVIATFNGSASEVRVDGSPGTVGSLTANGLAGLVLSAGGGKDFHGYVGEVVIYKGALSAQDQDELFSYFQSRYPL